MKKIQYLLILIVFFIGMFFISNKTSANELIGMMKVYKLKINLINIDTNAYTIELIDGIEDRIYETQEGNEKGQHIFSIASDMDESHLSHYSIKLRFKNGDVKNFDTINIEKLVNIDNDNNNSTYSYEYNVMVKVLSRSVITFACVIILIGVIVTLAIYLIKHKKRFK